MKIKKIHILVLGLFFTSQVVSAQSNPVEKFDDFLKALHANYVDDINDDEVLNIAIKAVLKDLDPHSRYYTQPQFGDKKEKMSGAFTGIGVELSVVRDTACITQVTPGGPAEKAGLMSGDRILKIDSENVAGCGLGNPDIVMKIRGPRKTTVKMMILRYGHQVKVSVQRDIIPDNSISLAYMVNDSIGYIALRMFNKTTREEVDTTLISMLSKGMKSLILDLQSNGGGYVESALGLADEFLKREQLVYYSVGHDKGKDYYYAGGSGQFSNGKLVILIDQATASASEIFTGAMQDWDRALIVGRRSFGKGLMQKPVTLFDGSVLDLTGARYYTPTGRSLQKPYKNIDYLAEVQNRFSTGEMTNPAVVKMPDSLMYKTLVIKRTVYGGGGIMPDVYVPVNVFEYGEWAKKVLGSNMFSQSTFEYVDRNRETLTKRFPDEATFEKAYNAPTPILKSIMKKAAEKGLNLKREQKRDAIILMCAEFKAQVASQLYHGSRSYKRILNQTNATYIKALHILENGSYYSNLKQNHK